MTEEQIKQKAEAEADKVIIGSGMDRASVIHLKHLLVTMYMQGATESTKELEAQIEKMKRHANCKHCDSEGYCEVRKTYLIDLSYYGCDEWELED